MWITIIELVLKLLASLVPSIFKAVKDKKKLKEAFRKGIIALQEQVNASAVSIDEEDAANEALDGEW